MPWHTIDRHAVFLRRGDYQADVFIRLWPADPSAAGFDYAYVLFYEGDHIPANTIAADGRPRMRAPLSEYAMYLDVLRNEKPLQLYVGKSSPPRMFVASEHKEPVGENEEPI